MENPFQNYEIQKKKKTSERAEVISRIYELYLGDRQNRKKENWKRYCAWCRENKLPKGKESENKFRKSKMFIQELPVKVIAIKLSPFKDLPTLYYIKSVCEDKYNRGENIGAYLLGSIKTFVKIK